MVPSAGQCQDPGGGQVRGTTPAGAGSSISTGVGPVEVTVIFEASEPREA